MLFKERNNFTSIQSVIFIFPRLDAKLAQAKMRTNSVCVCVLIIHVMYTQSTKLLVTVTLLGTTHQGKYFFSWYLHD